MVGLGRVGSTTPIAILDDYQGVALGMADWSLLEGRAHIVVFRDHISDATELVSRLSQFEVICVLRERTPLPRSILQRLPNLKLIASVTMRNASIDMVAAKELASLYVGQVLLLKELLYSLGLSFWQCYATCQRS